MSIKIRPLVFKIYEPEDTVTIGTQVWKNANLAVDDGGYSKDTPTRNTYYPVRLIKDE